MTKIIVVIGAQGTGKTYLSHKLEKELKSRGKTVELVDEVARSCLWGINEQSTFLSQRWIFHEQMRKELETEYKNPDIILCDRGIVDNLAYAERLHNRGENFPITEYLQMVEIARYWSQKYDYIIHMPLNLNRLKDDGVRSTDISFARDIDKKINKLLGDFKLDNIIKYRKNFNIMRFCDKIVPRQKKLKKVVVRKRNNKK